MSLVSPVVFGFFPFLLFHIFNLRNFHFYHFREFCLDTVQRCFFNLSLVNFLNPNRGVHIIHMLRILIFIVYGGFISANFYLLKFSFLTVYVFLFIVLLRYICILPN